MARVFIPAQLRELTGGANDVEVAGKTVREVIAALDGIYPGIAARLQSADRLAPGLGVSVDGVMSNQGLRTRVGSDSEVHFVPALVGG